MLMPSPIVLVAFLIGFIWLGTISFFLYKFMSNLRVLTAGGDKRSLDAVLAEIMKQAHVAKKDIATLAARCDTMELNEQFHIQKIGLLRFNPFNDTGGDQSFILTLVDAHDTGVVVTALYSRSGTRWYAKRVMRGKGSEHELSDEEKKAMKMAKPIQGSYQIKGQDTRI